MVSRLRIFSTSNPITARITPSETARPTRRADRDAGVAADREKLEPAWGEIVPLRGQRPPPGAIGIRRERRRLAPVTAAVTEEPGVFVPAGAQAGRAARRCGMVRARVAPARIPVSCRPNSRESRLSADEDRPATPPASDAHPSRRRFIGWLSKAFLSLWGLGSAAAVGAYLRAPERGERAADRIVRVGALDEMPIGEARMIRHGVTPFFVVRLDARRIVAVSAVCTHVRCILGFDRERKSLVCPCHDGRFDLAGNVLSGPPPRPLATYDVSVRSGDVFVHL